jgi:hypothetical protein
VIEKSVRIEFLKKMHLFHGLNDIELGTVADELQEQSFDEAGLVFKEGSKADTFHIIFQGRVVISRQVKSKEIKIATLVKGDYYGEQGLLRNKNRNASITAEQGTIILIYNRKQFLAAIKKVPSLRHNFEIMIESRQLGQQLKFNWLTDNEVIYFLARKHPFLLIFALLIPAIVLIPIIGILVLAYIASSAMIGLVGGILLSLDVLWAVWRAMDWGNDYYIVTNQRVIWLEKVIALYDSRVEAGMGTILSVSTETEYLGRILDYGTVVVRTYTGQIPMVYVRHPKQAAAMIEEYWDRAKEVGRKANEDVMKQAIRTKLGLNKPTPAAPPPPPATAAKAAKKPNPLSDLWKNAFRMRTEDGSTVTYHKHVYVLFRNLFPYGLGIVGLTILVFAWRIWFGAGMPLWLGMIIMFLTLVLFGFMAYQYLDWKNDIYQVTAEQIIDVSRKPFGTEDRKAAPLENILSTEYKRTGIIGMLFNFGTVFIMVGGAKFDFSDVADPPSVQQDIIRRQQGRQQKKRDTESFAERERMSEWLAMYHRTMDEVNREKDQSRGPDSV